MVGENVVGYVRVSTAEQAAEGVSLDAQAERIKAYCAMAGLQLVALVREEGVSGTVPLTDRKGGGELVREMVRNKARHVVALKLDRLFRDAADALNQTKAWDKAEVALHLIDVGGQTINTSTAMGRMFLTMMAGFAELERNLIAERTTAALAHKKAKRMVYAPTPLGFDRVGEELVINGEERAIVLRIKTARAEGKALNAIAAELNADGVPTKRGGKWFASTVRYIERNGIYADE